MNISKLKIRQRWLLDRFVSAPRAITHMSDAALAATMTAVNGLADDW